jgi:hypothetical protein
MRAHDGTRAVSQKGPPAVPNSMRIKKMGGGRQQWQVADRDLARQAVSALRGYVYQIHQTAAAWINLAEGELLFLEVAEDFAEIIRDPDSLDEVLRATQVKDGREGGAVTLNSPDVLDAIEALCRLRAENPGREVRLTFLTTSPIGTERKNPLKSGLHGLKAWSQAAQDGDVEEIRSALLKRLGRGPARRFIRTASRKVLRQQLLASLVFVCGAGNWRQVQAANKERLVAMRADAQATPDMASRAYASIFQCVVETILSPGTRMLDRRRLIGSFRLATTFAVPSQVLTDYMARISVSEVLRDVERSEHEPRLPLDLEMTAATDGLLRFSPYNSRVPFSGRRAELAELRQFMDAPVGFSWWLITGDGGMGKTRLAAEHCMRMRMLGWRAGFLPVGVALNYSVMTRWQPQTPTLIVVDYLMQRADRIRGLISRLARIPRTTAPIRIILLEREAGEGFDREFLGSSQSDRGVLLSAQYAAPFNLAELSREETWAVVEKCSWRADGKGVGVDLDAFSARLRKFDRKRRPLVAMILADSLAEGGSGAAGGQLNTHLRELIRRDRQLFWPAKLGAGDQMIGGVDADVAIALATLLNGLGRRELSAVAKVRGRELQPSMLRDCARAIGKPFSKRRQRLGRLEPDLIGEFFVLETLRGEHSNPLSDARHEWLPVVAWRLNGPVVTDFVERARQNFPRHPALRSLLNPVPDVADSWWCHALSIIDTKGLTTAYEKLFAALPIDVGAAIALGRLLVSLSATAGMIEARQLLRVMDLFPRFVFRMHPRAIKLRRLWAGSILNFINLYGRRYPKTSQRLIETLTALLRECPDRGVAGLLLSAVMGLLRNEVRLPLEVIQTLGRDAFRLGLPLQTEPTEIAVWSVMLQITEEKLAKGRSRHRPTRRLLTV